LLFINRDGYDVTNKASEMMRKTPTLKDVAGRLGMHKSTVSLALSGKGTISAETRQQVLSAAHELGYEPNPIAQRLASGNGASMVCIFSGVLDVGLATEKILLIQKALAARSLEVPIYTCYDPVSAGNKNDLGDGRSQAAQVRQLCRQRPRAVICAAQRVHPAVLTELETYQSNGGIVVAYDTPVSLACDRVIFDREDNAYRAARHVLEQGHRRIGIAMSEIVGGARDPQGYRLNGFRRAPGGVRRAVSRRMVLSHRHL
jgi:DNA-binding LacI/PurR family transcriptional regulator